MTIEKYTFFSPNGNDFPVTSNADGKLYMMLTGMEYRDLRIKHWTQPLDTSLNRVYVNTSIIAGGRYFELKNHAVPLLPTATNFVHAIIDLSNSADPVSITVEKTNTSNSIDINNESGVLKICFDIITTDSSSIVKSNVPEQVTRIDNFTMKTIAGNVDLGNGLTISYQKKGEIVSIRFFGALLAITGSIYFPNKVPAEIVVNETKELVGHYAGENGSFHIDIETDGRVRWWGGTITANKNPRGTAVYFIK